MSREASRRVAVLLLAVALVGVVTGSGILSPRVATIVNDLAQLSAGIAAAIACLRTARHRSGAQRRWRRLIGVAMACWSAGIATSALHRSVHQVPLPSPSPADLCFLAFPALAMLALLTSTGPAIPGTSAGGYRRRWAIGLIDTMIVVASLFALTWMTTLGTVVGTNALTTWAIVTAIGYLVADYLLVTVVVVLWATKRVPRRMHDQLALLGSGIATLAVSDSVCTYRTSGCGHELSVFAEAGFLLGPALITVAATLPPASLREHGSIPLTERATLVLPYALVGGIWTLITLDNIRSSDPRGLALAGWAVLALLLVRHVCTVLENSTLHRQISVTRAELTHQAHHAHHDSLTGLANRALFDTRLRGALERHRAGCGSVAVLLLDLDDFKSVNDRYGHGCGDDLLRTIGERLHNSVRSGDTAARLGGDEFAVVLEHCTESPNAVAARIHAAVQAPYELTGRILTIGVSVGVAEPAPDEADVSPQELMRRADAAMYEGKRRGKSTVVAHRRERAPVFEG